MMRSRPVNGWIRLTKFWIVPAANALSTFYATCLYMRTRKMCVFPSRRTHPISTRVPSRTSTPTPEIGTSSVASRTPSAGMRWRWSCGPTANKRVLADTYLHIPLPPRFTKSGLTIFSALQARDVRGIWFIFRVMPLQEYIRALFWMGGFRSIIWPISAASSRTNPASPLIRIPG